MALIASLMLAMLFSACSMPGTAPGGKTASTLASIGAASFTSGEVFEALPPGDFLMTVDAGTLINTTIPQMLANQPDHKAKFDAELKEAFDKSGVDPKQFKLVAISASLQKREKKAEVSAILNGAFDAAKMKESLKKDPKTGVEHRTETYEGLTIYIVEDKGTGTPAPSDAKPEEAGVAMLDDTTVAFGSPVSRLKASIDAHAKKADSAAKDAELIGAFKSTKESSLMRFAMRVPQDELNKEANDPMMAPFKATKFFFGSLDGANGLSIDLTARAGTAEEAKPMLDKLNELLAMGKQKLGAMPEMKNMASVLEQVQVSSNGPDVKLAMTIPTDTMNKLADDIGGMFGSMMGGAMGMHNRMPEAGEKDDHDASDKDDDE